MATKKICINIILLLLLFLPSGKDRKWIGINGHRIEKEKKEGVFSSFHQNTSALHEAAVAHFNSTSITLFHYSTRTFPSSETPKREKSSKQIGEEKWPIPALNMM